MPYKGYTNEGSIENHLASFQEEAVVSRAKATGPQLIFAEENFILLSLINHCIVYQEKVFYFILLYLYSCENLLTKMSVSNSCSNYS